MTGPKTLRLGTFNLLRDRSDGRARGDVRAILRDHDLHALAYQEGHDYADALERVHPDYRLLVRRGGRGYDQNGWIVREDVTARGLHIVDLGGDGWTTVTGLHHVGLVATAVTLAGWLRGVSLHLPPSIDWPHGRPVGPAERVDDYIAAMRRLLRYAAQRTGPRGLLYVGDWNCRPGRDEGFASASWLARAAFMRIGRAPNQSGALHGIDFPMVDRDTILTHVRQQDRYGSDHPLVTFKATRRGTE